MIYFVSLAVLVAVFAVGTVRPINMGLLGFVAAFLVGGWLSGIPVDKLQSFFPGDMFLVVVGITLLFGIATANGTIELIMSGALRLVRGKPWAIVWFMFLLAAVMMGLGSVLAVGMLAPIAMPLAKKHKIDPLLMGMMISHGALAAAFSPVTVYSVAIRELTNDQGIAVSPLTLFAVPFILNLLLAAGLFFVRGQDLIRRGGDSIDTTDLDVSGSGGASSGVAVQTRPAPDTATVTNARTSLRLDHYLTFLAMGALLATAFIGIKVGIASIVLAVALLLVSPKTTEPAMKSIAWPAVVLVCGIVTYMEVLTSNGTIDYLGEQIMQIPWPLLTAGALFLIAGIISAVASSFGMILIALPLAAPLLANGELGAAGFVIALSFCATIVDVSPFSTNGIIVLSSAQVDDQKQFQRRMLRYTGYIIIVAPLIAVLGVVAPTTL